MHKAIIKNKKGKKEEIYFTYSRHSDELKVTAFCVGEGAIETYYVRDENIIKIIPDPSVHSIMDF